MSPPRSHNSRLNSLIDLLDGPFWRVVSRFGLWACMMTMTVGIWSFNKWFDTRVSESTAILKVQQDMMETKEQIRASNKVQEEIRGELNGLRYQTGETNRNLERMDKKIDKVADRVGVP